MSLRFWRALLWFLSAMVVLGLGAWFLLLRPVPQEATSDPAKLFNHGSIGNEAAQGLPYWIWRVLPKVFPDLMPGDQDGYGAFGLFWASGDEVPIGLSVKTLGAIPRVSPNCAFCHQGSYRLAPEDPARLVTAGPGTRSDPQSYIRFVTRAGGDPRFTADRLMEEIEAIYDMKLWERITYRFLLIPATRKALTRQAQQFAWMETRPDWGPGRIDPFNPVKFQNLRLGDDGTIGNSDMMPLWDLQSTEATDTRRFALHWDGLQTDLTETVISGAIGDGMDHRAYPATKAALMVMERTVARTLPPPSPFSARLPAGDPFHLDPAAVEAGRAIYLRDCAECHEPTGARYRTVIPLAELGTDHHRLDMWSEAAKTRYLAYEPGHDWGFQYFQKTDGYVAVPLTGLWLRGPYLHNGSVPTLAALLAPPGERPAEFWRGSDLVDAENGGFMSRAGADPQRRLWHYDTTEPGNANGGHLWGTGLDPASKAALLAYLKTL